MDEVIQYIRYLDQLAVRSKTEQNCQQNELMTQIGQLCERPDALQIVPIIMANAESDNVLIAGSRILQFAVKNQWNSMTPEAKLEFRDFLIRTLQTFPPVLPVYSSLEKVVVSIAIHEFPNGWPDFITNFILVQPPRFQLLSNFINSFKTQQLTPERYCQIHNAICEHIPTLLQGIYCYFPQSSSLLTEVIPFMSLETVVAVATSPIFQQANPPPEPLCRLLMTPNFPTEHVRSLFNLYISSMKPTEISQLNNEINYIISLLQQHLEVLEHPETIDALNYVHKILFEVTLDDTIEYWEYFLLSIFSSGNNDRIQLHQKVINELLLTLINQFTTPPDFHYIGGNKDAYQTTALFEPERTMILCLIRIDPQTVIQQMSNAYGYLAQNFNDGGFVSLVWAAASLSSAVNLDDDFALASLQFVYTVYLSNPQDMLRIACFIYLAMHYIKVGKISPDMLLIAANFALNGISVPEIQRLSADFLLTASKETIVPNLDTALLLNLNVNSISPEIFCLLSEATARTYMQRGELEQAVVQVVGNRWQYCKFLQQSKQSMSFEFARELRNLMSGLIGFARANIECVASILVSQSTTSNLPSALAAFAFDGEAGLMPSLEQCTTEFVKMLLEMHGAIGDQAKRRDDAQLMIGFIRNEMLLFKETRYMNCQWIISLFALLPLEMKPHEAISLANMLVQSDISPEMLQLIRNAIITPVEMLISASSGENAQYYRMHITTLSQLLLTLAIHHYELITAEDMTILLQILPRADKQSVTSTIYAFQTILMKSIELLKGEMRVSFFRQILPAVLTSCVLLACEPSHRFFFVEIIELVEYCVNIIANDQIGVQLFPDLLVNENNVVSNTHTNASANVIGNIQGMVQKLANEIVENNSGVTIREMSELCAMLFRPQQSNEEFEEVIVQIVSKAKDSLPDETMRQLKTLKIKASLYK